MRVIGQNMCLKSARTRAAQGIRAARMCQIGGMNTLRCPKCHGTPDLPATGHTFWPMTQNPEISKAAAQHWRDGLFCGLDGIRTHDLLFRRQTLYPLSYKPVRPSTIPTCADDMRKRYVQTAYADARTSWTPRLMRRHYDTSIRRLVSAPTCQPPRRSTPRRSTRTLSTSALPADDARASVAHRPALG